LRKSKEEAEKTRYAVLEAALDVFSEKGYAKATFDEIATRAGYTKGAVYWYFKNKADLVSSLIAEYVLRKQEQIASLLPKGNTLDDLLKYFEIWSEVSQSDVRFGKFRRFILCQMEWSEALVEKVEQNLAKIKNGHLEKINDVLVESRRKGVLKEDTDIDKVQHSILSAYMGIMFSYLSKRFVYSATEMVHIGLGLMLEGLKK